MPAISFTAKEIHIIVQLIRLAVDDDAFMLSLSEYAKTREIEIIKTKLQNVKDG